MIEPDKPYFTQSLDALKVGDRRLAASLLQKQLEEGRTSRKNLPSVFTLATHIGEMELAIDASRQAILPGSVESLVDYWGALASYGRWSEALADMATRPAPLQGHPLVLHFRGSIASQLGRFEEAEGLFRDALKLAPALGATWLSLAMIKKFAPGDDDIAAMERVERERSGPTQARAPLYYALGKASEECGDIDRAFSYYSQGAGLRAQQTPFNLQAFAAAADQVIRDYTPESIAALKPSGYRGSPSVFVTGLPRSGTTLTEQILVGHSAVADGGEIGVFGPATLPLLGLRLSDVQGYERRAQSPDPWAEIAQDYEQFVHTRFRTDRLIVDKSLGEALLTGFRLHSMPDAKIAWLRRNVEDVALSCYRTYFAVGQNWTCSLTDIADYMRIEQRLFDHWQAVFPGRILPVPYEDMAAQPAEWSKRLQAHFGLPFEEGIESKGNPERAVRTASAAQVREPISTKRIGQAQAFERHLEPFRARFFG